MKTRTKQACKLSTYKFSSNFHELAKLRQEKLPLIQGSRFSLQSRNSKVKMKERSLQSSLSAVPSGLRRSMTEVYTNDRREEPSFILAGRKQLSKLCRSTDWKHIEEPPTVYTLSRMPSTPSVLSSVESADCLEVVPKEETNERTFLTSIQMALTSKNNHSFTLKTLKGMTEMKRTWYPVSKKVRVVINDNFVREIKPCNFRRTHQELLPTIPEVKYKKSMFALKGKSLSFDNTAASLSRNSAHDLRVFNRDGTPWVPYQLKSSLKIKQDTFCINYSALLKRSGLKNSVSEKLLQIEAADSFKDPTHSDTLMITKNVPI